MNYNQLLETAIEQFGLKRVALVLNVPAYTLALSIEEDTLSELVAGQGVIIRTYAEIVQAIKTNRRLDGRRLPTRIKEEKPNKKWDITIPHYRKETKEWRWLTEDGSVDYNDLRNYTKSDVKDIEMPHIEWCAACGFILEMPDEQPIPCPYPRTSKKWRGLDDSDD